MSSNKCPTFSTVFTTLQLDIDHILLRLLDALKIHHRHYLSINLLGTALKHIAETPDFDDFNQLQTRTESLIEVNEEEIYDHVKLSQLTDTVNN